MLACGYLFDALMIVPHALTFPGLFAPAGLLGAGAQTTAWLYMLWHAGFALAVIAYALLSRRPDGAARPRARTALLGVAATITAVVALGALVTLGQRALPSIMSGNGYDPAMLPVASSVWGLSFVALFVLWSKRPFAVLDLWLLVVMSVWIFDVALSTVLNAGRFDLGFYMGRVFGLMAASFVLAVLLLELSGLNSRLAKATARLDVERRRLEASKQRTEDQLWQAQKMEAVGNLTGGLAHDFNNLLGVVIGSLDSLLERKGGDAEVAELAGDALDAGLRGAELTRRLLAFARRQPLSPRRIEINTLAESVAKLLGRTLGEAIEIKVLTAPAPWPVIADPAQLEASLINLATNARDAMPKGGRLTITAANRTLDADYAALNPGVLPGDYVMIEVSDTGCGMSKAVLARVFEPFFTTKDPGKGSGLGLAMVFGFMRQSQGHINVYSEPGLGSTFRLYLPRAASDADAAAAPASPPAAVARGETVLAVEDNGAMRRILVRQLRDLGYRVLEAETGAAALALLEREHADLLLTDVIMPGGMTGPELARAAAPCWPRLRVVLTSGFPEVTMSGHSGVPAASRILSKPYRKEDLARVLRDALDSEGGS